MESINKLPCVVSFSLIEITILSLLSGVCT